MDLADAVSQASVRSFTVGDRTFVFRRPNAARWTEIDVLLARYRGGMPAAAMTFPLISEARAVLNVMCQDPVSVVKDKDGFDFGDLDDDDLLGLYTEVSKWLESFRRPVQQAQEGVGG